MKLAGVSYEFSLNTAYTGIISYDLISSHNCLDYESQGECGMLYRYLVMVITVMIGTASAPSGPPIPQLRDTEPGIQLLFTGDPNTTEQGDSPNGPLVSSSCSSGIRFDEMTLQNNYPTIQRLIYPSSTVHRL